MSRGFATEGKEEEKKGELVHHVRDAVAARSMAGTPEMLEKRVAKISRPCKNAMQSGTGNVRQRRRFKFFFFFFFLPFASLQTHKWRVQFLSNGRWENPLMGWASTADPLGYLTIDFETEEQAVRFCDDQGFKYTVQEPRRKHCA